MRSAVKFALPLLVVAAPLQAQRSDDEWLNRCERNDWGNNRERFCDVKVTTFRPGSGSIRVDPGNNGGVSIVGWERPEVEVHMRIQAYAGTRTSARDIASDVRLERTGNAVSADGPEGGRREGWHVEFLVYVPRQSDLALRTSNGPLHVRDVTGTMDLRTTNGPLSLDGVAGDVTARTSNGPLSVHLAGSRWQGAGLDAETSNGPATVFVPEGYSADFETGTVNGPMHSEFPLTVTFSGRMRQRFNTRLGNGGAPVRVVTSNGPLALKRP